MYVSIVNVAFLIFLRTVPDGLLFLGVFSDFSLDFLLLVLLLCELVLDACQSGIAVFKQICFKYLFAIYLDDLK